MIGSVFSELRGNIDSAMNQQHLRERIIEILKQVAPDADVEHLDPRHSFRDQLDMDSVDFLNFVLAIEAELDVRIPDEDHMNLSTLGGCVAYLSRQPVARAYAEAVHG